MIKQLIIGALLCVPFLSYARADNSNQFTAQSWVVADDSGKIINGQNASDVRSIASITKLMTAMVVLDSKQPLDQVVSTKLYGKKLTRRQLIDLAIIRSDNNAARILCEQYPTGLKGCVRAMNDKATALKMTNTFFIEPTGLLNENVSTAEELIKLVIAASSYPVIVEDSNKKSVKLPVNKQKNFEYRNTNTLVGNGLEFIVSKTGYISRAGGCIVMMLHTNQGIRTVVLLGSKNTKTRIPEAKLLALAY